MKLEFSDEELSLHIMEIVKEEIESTLRNEWRTKEKIREALGKIVSDQIGKTVGFHVRASLTQAGVKDAIANAVSKGIEEATSKESLESITVTAQKELTSMLQVYVREGITRGYFRFKDRILQQDDSL